MMEVFTLLGAILDDVTDIDFMRAITTYDEDTDAVKYTYTHLPMINKILALFGKVNSAHWKKAYIVFGKTGDDYAITSVSLSENSMEMIMDSEAIDSYVSQNCLEGIYHGFCNELAELAQICS